MCLGTYPWEHDPMQGQFNWILQVSNSELESDLRTFKVIQRDFEGLFQCFTTTNDLHESDFVGRVFSRLLESKTMSRVRLFFCFSFSLCLSPSPVPSSSYSIFSYYLSLSLSLPQVSSPTPKSLPSPLLKKIN